MGHHLREQLGELAQRLNLHAGDSSDPAHELSTRIAGALEAEDHDGLREGLEESVVEFEVDHPDLAALIRRAVDALAAAGL